MYKDIYAKYFYTFKSTIKNISTINDLGQVVSDYNTEMANLMDRHAPKVTKEVKIVPSAPWFDTEYNL